MNLPPPVLPMHSPCPASVRRAPGFQIGSVSYDNQIRDESLRGLPRERDGGKGGGRTVCQPGRRMDCTEMGSLSPTLLGRHIASNKGKKENPGPHSFEPGGYLPPAHTHTKIGKLNQNISLGLKLAKDYLRHVIRSLGSDGFQHQISAHDVRTQKSQLHPLKRSCQRTHELESDAGS